MAITNPDDYLASIKQFVDFSKVSTATSVAGSFQSVWASTPYPFNLSFNAGNTANGVVPTSADQGYPFIKTITNTGYITGMNLASSTIGSILFYDNVFKCGAYAFNSNVILAAQPSFASRIPSADYRGLELWFQAATAFTGLPQINVTYTNQDGVTGRTYGVQAIGTTPIIGRMYRLLLQGNDTGVQKIESVVATIATAGTFNLMILRPLIVVGTAVSNASQKLGLFETGMPIVYSTSAIFPICFCSTTATPIFHLKMEISDK